MTVDEELEIFAEGVIDLISREELRQKLERSRKKKRPLKIKYGADPSAPDLHLGHTVPLRKLRRLQELGHQVIFIIGDFTAQIGDPSEQPETRRRLSKSEVQRNAKSYQAQVFRILDPQKTKLVFNSRWLARLTPSDFLALTSRYTVARLLERDDFLERFESKKPITLLEFMYPLLQGYDSVFLGADVEVGGTDQKFNLLVGRELLRDYGKAPQVVMTLPLIEGTDGHLKMSKSLGNAIGIQESAREMFGKIMSVPDSLTVRYFSYVTDFGSPEVQKIERELANGSLHPREAKSRLAWEIVRLYHSPKVADRARTEFDRVFKEGGLPDEIHEVYLSGEKCTGETIDIVSLLEEAKLTSSRSEARRLIRQGGVKVNERKVLREDEQIRVAPEALVQCGKRKFARVRIA